MSAFEHVKLNLHTRYETGDTEDAAKSNKITVLLNTELNCLE